MDKVAEGSILYTDGARAYESLCKERGLKWSSLDHSSGEFVRRQRLRGKLRVVFTQGIDGGGVYTDHLEANVKEFQWRQNLPDDADPFIALLLLLTTCCVRDNFFQ